MKQKKQFTMPHVFVILFVLLVVATIATYIVPAGTYDFMEVNGKNVINPDSFHYIDQTPVGPWQMIMDIPQACVNAAMLIICLCNEFLNKSPKGFNKIDADCILVKY